MTKQLLIETMQSSPKILEEATKDNGGRMKVKLVWGSCDEVNGNGRVYPEAIQDREIEKLRPLIEEKCIYSEADHPEDGKSRIRYTAALPISIEKETIDGRKLYTGEAVILNTDQGKNLQEIIRAGGKVGVSQRGWGDTASGKWQGKDAEIVQENYDLKTFDFVIGQSTKGATVKEFTEQMEVINLIEAGPCEGCQQNCNENSTKGGTSVMEIKSLEELKKAYPDLCKQMEEQAMAAREKELKASMKVEWDANVKQIADGIQKKIEESQEYKDFRAGKNKEKPVLEAIAKIVKPYMSDAAGDDGSKIEERFSALDGKFKAVSDENKALKEQAEKDKTEAANKEKATKRIQEVTAGKEKGAILAERLKDCKTTEEVDKRLVEEEAFIAKLLTEVKGTPKGDGKVINENEDPKPQYTEEQKRDRRVAGLPA